MDRSSRSGRSGRSGRSVGLLDPPDLPGLPSLQHRMLRSRPEMDDIAPFMDQQDRGEPQIPSEPAPLIESRFLFVDVAALRAKQLRRGARPRLGADAPQAPQKAERVAMEEVRRGLVYYDVLHPLREG